MTAELKARKAEATRRYRKAHPERCIESSRKSLAKTPGLAARYAKKWREAHPGRAAAATMKWNYGLTAEQCDAMAEAQGGACAICLKVKKLCVDHDHVTGEVRGLLCVRCNANLAAIEDLVFRQDALEYLRRHAHTERKSA